MTPPLLPTSLISAILGITAHLTYFIHADLEKHVVFLVNCLIFWPSLGLIALFILGYRDISQWIGPAILSFHFSLLASIVIYRYFFHALDGFPGPKLARITALWDFKNTVLNAKWYIKVKEMHGVYGDVVRIKLAITAGSDTAASTLNALFYLLARHPDKLRRLQEEIDTAVPADEELSHAALVKKPYLEGCINESLRLCPAVLSGLQRETGPEGLRTAGVYIPPGMIVSVPTYTVQRDPRNFPRPNEFIPERWSTQPELVIHKEALNAFSSGTYSCAGKAFAMMEMRLLVSTIVHDSTVTSTSESLHLPQTTTIEPSQQPEQQQKQPPIPTPPSSQSRRKHKINKMGDYYRSGSADAYAEQSSPAADSHKRKLEDETSEQQPPADQANDRPISKRKRLEERHQKLRKRGQAPPSAYSRRDGDETAARAAPRPRSPSPPLPPRSPSPEVQARQRKRPGGGARRGLVDPQTLRRRQEERERALEEDAMRNSQSRGVTDIVRQHYNAVPQRGREWRKTESKIKGLRSFNNWVKSTLIQKFSPDEEFVARAIGTKDWADGTGPPPMEEKRLLVIDLGCGKGGDLGKWQLAPQPVDLYVGLDPAEVSIIQARERYAGMRSGRGPRGGRRGGPPLFHGEFRSKDCFGEWLGDVDIVQQVGIDPNVGPGGSMMASRWGGGGFDVVTSMFAIHYAFESEEKARQMLRNVAGCLKKGGRFIGVCPNSDIISARVAEFNAKRKDREAAKQDAEPEDGEVEEEAKAEWGNSIYRVRFPGDTPEDGIFRPPFGWKYSYFMEEAVGEIPEYVVPWEAFRALTEEYNLELQYRKPFMEVWRDEKDDPELGPLSERMGVRDRTTGELTMTPEEQEAVSFYHAFCFYKV
ncbi:hypothetical protein CBS115988_5978 [Aspergillus niger]|nr:hypothetical protein CBS115988_5978 [Aspergillus niger]KAI2883546.1 hypothetical protein CBS11852_9105 [Aspergillus niger]